MKPIVFVVTIEVEREEGRFAPRAEIEELLRTALDDADPGSLWTEDGATYVVTTWEVSQS